MLAPGSTDRFVFPGASHLGRILLGHGVIFARRIFVAHLLTAFPFQAYLSDEILPEAGHVTALTNRTVDLIAQIQYLMRVPDLAMAERITRVLDTNAESAARVAHCD